MSNKIKSIHLQDFPDVSFFGAEEQLVVDMDMVRDICGTALFIRDRQNLRVRLPLSKLTIIGKKAAKMLAYKDIIADEVNVKKIEILEDIGDLAEFKLQINFKEVGAKFGGKMKDISIAAKNGDWKRISENEIKIADEILRGSEFDIKLTTKDQESIVPLPSNDCLVQLDINVTKELEDEGLARDMVRAIQQNRKDADLNVSDHIKIKIHSSNQQLADVVKFYDTYIRDQVLASNIEFVADKDQIQDSKHKFSNKIENLEFDLGITLHG